MSDDTETEWMDGEWSSDEIPGKKEVHTNTGLFVPLGKKLGYTYRGMLVTRKAFLELLPPAARDLFLAKEEEMIKAGYERGD